MTDADQQALIDRVTALEAQLRVAQSGIPSPGAAGEQYERAPEGGIRLVGETWASMKAPPRSETVEVRELVGHDVSHDPREVRRFVVAVALCRHEPVPGHRIPRGYAPVVRQLAAVRKQGLTWRDALKAVALEPPSEIAVAERTRALRTEVAPIWNDLLPVVTLFKQRGTAVAGGDALKHVEQLMI